MNHDNKDILAKASAQLKQEGLTQQVPKTLVDETLRRLADARTDDIRQTEPARIPVGRTIRLAFAAAALIAVGCIIGRLSRPAPVNIDKLQEAMVPSIAASIEPVIRANVIEDLQQRYQLALAATYVKVKEELTAQYRDEMNRNAILTLAASNAATNRLLADAVESIDTAQSQDFSRFAKVIYQIEQNRIQDRKQFAVGLQTLASRTEENRQLVQLLVDVLPEDRDAQRDGPVEIPHERTEP